MNKNITISVETVRKPYVLMCASPTVCVRRYFCVFALWHVNSAVHSRIRDLYLDLGFIYTIFLFISYCTTSARNSDGFDEIRCYCIGLLGCHLPRPPFVDAAGFECNSRSICFLPILWFFLYQTSSQSVDLILVNILRVGLNLTRFLRWAGCNYRGCKSIREV